jgi:hypothetical protein
MVKHDEFDDLPDVKSKPYKGGVILPEDDLSVGDYICVYSIKRFDEPEPIMGQSMLVKAICLPFIAAELQSDPNKPVLTLDVRYLNLMKVTKEYVDAQSAGCTPVPRKKKNVEKPAE